jgi:hypothetical protein
LIWRAEGLESGAEGSLGGIGRETGIEGDGAAGGGGGGGRDLIWRAEGLESGAEGSLEGIEREIGIEEDGAAGGGEAERSEEIFFGSLEGETEQGDEAAEAIEEFLGVGGAGAEGFGVESGAGAEIDPGFEGGQREWQTFQAGETAFGESGSDAGEVEIGLGREGSDEIEQGDGDGVFEFAAVDEGAQGGGAAGGGDARVKERDSLFFAADKGEALIGKFMGAGEIELGLEAGVCDAAIDEFAAEQDDAVAAAEAVENLVHAFEEIDAGFAAEGLEGDFTLGGKEDGPSGGVLQMVHAEADQGGGIGRDEGGESGVDALAGRAAFTGGEGEGRQQEGSP